MKKNSILIIIALSFVSCDLLYDEGGWETELRDISSYRNVIIEDIAEVYYHYCDTFAIEVHHYENELSSVSTQVSNHNLVIKNNFSGQAYTDIRNPQVHLYAPHIYYVEIAKEIGAGFFCKDTMTNSRFQIEIKSDLAETEFLVNTDTLQMNINKAAGIIKMAGHTNYCYIQNSGMAPIKGKKLHINQLNIIQQSSQNVEFTVFNKINYQILRNGNLIIWGNPENTGEILGTGKLILK